MKVFTLLLVARFFSLQSNSQCQKAMLVLRSAKIQHGRVLVVSDGNAQYNQRISVGQRAWVNSLKAWTSGKSFLVNLSQRFASSLSQTRIYHVFLSWFTPCYFSKLICLSTDVLQIFQMIHKQILLSNMLLYPCVTPFVIKIFSRHRSWPVWTRYSKLIQLHLFFFSNLPPICLALPVLALVFFLKVFM